jgi:formylglycine-generating enzyme required for sulfatase activity
LTQASQSAGYTALFAAPEQLRGRPADARSDVYSLAAALYYALRYDDPAGREPEHFDEARVPEAFRPVLAVALHPNPSRRPAHAAAFRDLLAAVPPPAPARIAPAPDEAPELRAASPAERAEVQRIVEAVRGHPERLEQLARKAKRAFQDGQWSGLRPQLLALLMLLPDRTEPVRRVLAMLDGPTAPPAAVFHTNSLGMRLMLIPARNFLQGAADGEPGSLPAERPQHRVTLTRPFFLGVCPVTQQQYAALMGHNPSQFCGGPEYPVENVTWQEAAAFCRALSDQPREKAAGRVYRLPTEAEWEFACRAGTQRLYVGTDDPERLRAAAWFATNSEGTTHPVGTRAPNAWGLHDMLGNVWEWCRDWYAADYYRHSPALDPQGPPGGKGHVERGGSCVNGPAQLRAAFRNCRAEPGYAEGPVGFRVACDWTPQAG